jgi:hypothetical protein
MDIKPFRKTASTALQSTSTASANIALPAPGADAPVLIATNVDPSNIVYVEPGVVSPSGVGGPVATTASIAIPPNGRVVLDVRFYSAIAFIAGAGTPSLSLVQGVGYP